MIYALLCAVVCCSLHSTVQYIGVLFTMNGTAHKAGELPCILLTHVRAHVLACFATIEAYLYTGYPPLSLSDLSTLPIAQCPPPLSANPFTDFCTPN